MDAPAPGEPASTATTTPNPAQPTGRRADGGTASRCIAVTVAPAPAAAVAGSMPPGAATNGTVAATMDSTSARGSAAVSRRAAAASTGCSSSTATGAGDTGAGDAGAPTPRPMSCC